MSGYWNLSPFQLRVIVERRYGSVFLRSSLLISVGDVRVSFSRWLLAEASALTMGTSTLLSKLVLSVCVSESGETINLSVDGLLKYLSVGSLVHSLV